jgi:hypothetical protein
MNGDKTEDDAAFDESFLGWLAGPMKAVWFCWTVLYVHDVFSKILVIPIDDMGFDIGVYILTSGALAIMTTSRFLPKFPRDPLQNHGGGAEDGHHAPHDDRDRRGVGAQRRLCASVYRHPRSSEYPASAV